MFSASDFSEKASVAFFITTPWLTNNTLESRMKTVPNKSLYLYL